MITSNKIHLKSLYAYSSVRWRTPIWVKQRNHDKKTMVSSCLVIDSETMSENVGIIMLETSNTGKWCVNTHGCDFIGDSKNDFMQSVWLY